MSTHPVTPVNRPVQVRLKPELHQWVHQQAKTQERSANWIINKVLEQASARSQQLEGAQA